MLVRVIAKSSRADCQPVMTRFPTQRLDPMVLSMTFTSKQIPSNNLMSSRFVAIFAAILAGGAIWFLISDDTTRVSPPSELVEVRPKSTWPRVHAALPSQSAAETTSLKAPTQFNDDRRELDETLQLFPGNTATDITNTAQALIDLLPKLTKSGQTECAEHISNLLSDEEYPRVLQIWINPDSDPDVLQVFAKDLMNRPARVMMPAMLDAIRIVNHPFHEEAKRTMRIILDQDHGDNIPQWESAMNAFLEKEAN